MVFTSNPNRLAFKKMEKDRMTMKKRVGATSADEGWKGVVARGSVLRESESEGEDGGDSLEKGAGEWHEHLDQDSGKFYLYNLVTGETKWK